MTIARDNSNLPRGLQPDAEPRFIQVLVEQWKARNDAEGDRATAVAGSRFRFSDAAKCSRAISYKAAGIPRSNPMDLSGVWNTSLGTIVHDHWQTALQAAYPDAEIEVKVTVDGLDGSGHGDATIRLDGKTVVYELKTVGGFGYKNAIGKARRGQDAEGPSSAHIVQVALAGRAQDADEVVVGYLAKECLSMGAAGDMPELGRFCAEWTFSREQYELIADVEIARITGILTLVDDGFLAARKVPFETPSGAEIVDPATSRWEIVEDGVAVDTGTVWGGQYCLYCGWLDTCTQLPSGRIPVETAVAISKAAS